DRLAQARAERFGLAGQLGIAEGLDLGLERVDAVDDRLERADLALVGIPQAGEELEHREAEYIPIHPIRPSGACVLRRTVRAPDSPAWGRTAHVGPRLPRSPAERPTNRPRGPVARRPSHGPGSVSADRADVPTGRRCWPSFGPAH